MRIFICHSTLDSDFVIKVASLLKPNFDEVFYYETQQRADENFNDTIGEAMHRCDYWLIFVGSRFSLWQKSEAAFAAKHPDKKVCIVYIRKPDGNYPEEPPALSNFTGRPIIEADPNNGSAALSTTWKIMQQFRISFRSFDGLPSNPNLFSYEKDIITFFTRMVSLGQQVFSPPASPDHEDNLDQLVERTEDGKKIREMLLDGCPSEWPTVTYWGDNGKSGPSGDSYVVAAALTKHHEPTNEACMIRNKLYFPEARTRQDFYFPTSRNESLHIAILVAGGIAPGINAVIDGIVQRHYQDAIKRNYSVLIHGIKNGLSSIILAEDSPGRIPNKALIDLKPDMSAEHAREGGSIIGTSRDNSLIENKAFIGKVVEALLGQGIKILYVIGGDGSMKLAHALWHYANTDNNGLPSGKRLSVVAIPKTMDNDILWVWQSFGFLSAVEKAREILTILDTEIKSNPRLCILQLFGSDSGFVVSHTVAASGSDQCDAALIPEVKFSLRGLAQYLKKQMCERKTINPSAIVPLGFVVMAETAIPTDAICYVDSEGNIPEDLRIDWDFIKKKIGLDSQQLAIIAKKINLSADEKEAIYKFHRMRRNDQRIQGQTSDELRGAGLKIVSRGLQELLVLPDPTLGYNPQPDWGKLRIVTNEPRHVLRSIAPTCSDIIIGQRLGTLAVDNAMVGYTDFMISQWLTEFVLVPLSLVVLGRKRIRMEGMFWQSVQAKTGQPDERELDTVGPLPDIKEP
jgi:6-phosphofructokinase